MSETDRVRPERVMPIDRPRLSLKQQEPDQYSTAHAKGAIGRLDFHFTLVLSGRAKPECAARGLNNRAARPLVWIIDKLVEPNL